MITERLSGLGAVCREVASCKRRNCMLSYTNHTSTLMHLLSTHNAAQYMISMQGVPMQSVEHSRVSDATLLDHDVADRCWDVHRHHSCCPAGGTGTWHRCLTPSQGPLFSGHAPSWRPWRAPRWQPVWVCILPPLALPTPLQQPQPPSPPLPSTALLWTLWLPTLGALSPNCPPR